MKIIGHISVGDIDYTSGIPRKDELTLEEFQRMLQTKELRELFQAQLRRIGHFHICLT